LEKIVSEQVISLQFGNTEDVVATFDF